MANHDEPLHVVFFPWLAFGHMLPFLECSKSLAKRGHRVSFISTPRNIERLSSNIPSDLSPLFNFVSFPLPQVENLPVGAESTNDILLPDQVQFLKKAVDGLQTNFSQFLQNSTPKPDWIMVDFFYHWAPPIASEFKIQCAFFHILPASFVNFMWGDMEAAVADNGAWRKTVEEFTVVPKWIPPPSNLAYRLHEAKSLLFAYQDNASGMADLKRFSIVAKGCSLFVIRGCLEFDPVMFSLAEQLFKKPCIPVGLLLGDDIRKEAAVVHPNSSEARIFEWLNKQSPRSVVYVAFGSEAMLSTEQERELALGLELSKTPFLWVLRRPAQAVAELLPEAFEEQINGYGVVVTDWVPQLKILNHASVGAFFSHCGWSSVIEGLQFGHPFVMMPLFADQGITARRLEAEKVGVEVLWDEEDGSFTREAVAKAVRKVMVEEEGKTLRSNTQKLQEVFVDKDLQESYVDKLIQHLRDHK
ncbi:UDP-rhamnose:rhamnosyltransferase 1 [Canna indica]|uniref:UDP-rhamnose:rhamnosyltransferase 1 n=1 Tax=Canna indica TaxID=4628 RepID=A0AAQ3PZK5_9LILI|nr:UDP-rhamnose:rhamnosyltransferase 1 [Canna indica]